MELRNLITFIHVAEIGSFTRAAEQLYVAQPSVSHAIAELEAYYNVRLFERINHTILLTDEGKRLLEYAHKILHISDIQIDNYKEK